MGGVGWGDTFLEFFSQDMGKFGNGLKERGEKHLGIGTDREFTEQLYAYQVVCAEDPPYITLVECLKCGLPGWYPEAQGGQEAADHADANPIHVGGVLLLEPT